MEGMTGRDTDFPHLDETVVATFIGRSRELGGGIW